MSRKYDQGNLPFDSFKYVMEFEWQPRTSLISLRLSHQKATINVSIADMESVYPHFQQAIHYLEGRGTPKIESLSYLRAWEDSALRMKGPIVLAHSGSHAIGALGSLRMLGRVVEAKTTYGSFWQLPLKDWDIQFPGFAKLVESCESLGLEWGLTSQALVEFLNRCDFEPTLELPVDINNTQ